MTTIKFKTVHATLNTEDHEIKVSGLHSQTVLSEHPDTAKNLEMRNEWRKGIRSALIDAGADHDDVWSAYWSN